MATTATARPKNDSLNGNGRGRGGVPQDAEISIDDSIKAAITDSAPINIILADTDLRIIYMNEASRRTLKTIENLLPCRVDEIVGKSVDEFHENPSYQRGILRNYKDLPRQAQIKLGDEILDLLVSATYDAEGNYTGPMVTWSVITEKVELERRNADVTNQLAAIDRNQAVIEFQMDGTIVKANENFLRTLGYSMDEIKGQHHRMFCEDSYTRSPEYKEFWARLNRGEYNAGEYKRIGKGGKEVWIQASYNAIADVNGKLVKVVKFASDITEAVKARQRQAEQEELEKKAQGT
jgi:methyl-accepting chemotaxis protein